MKQLDQIKLLVLDVDGTMTDGGVYITDQGNQFKKFNARDGLGIKEVMKIGIEVGIISHSLASEMVDTRANMLGIRYFYIGQQEKMEVLQEWVEEMGIDYDHVAYIGDDINDLEIMKKVGVAACPADSVEKIKSISKIVLKKKGGEGAVREFIDQYLLP